MLSLISLMNYRKGCHVVDSIFEGLSKAVHEKKPSYFDIQKYNPIEASQPVSWREHLYLNHKKKRIIKTRI